MKYKENNVYQNKKYLPENEHNMGPLMVKYMLTNNTES